MSKQHTYLQHTDSSFINVDGDLSEWFGNVKNPSDDAMPGVMSTDGAGEDFLATWDANNLYIGLTGVDMGAADLQIYIDSTTGGDTMGQSWYVVSHTTVRSRLLVLGGRWL